MIARADLRSDGRYHVAPDGTPVKRQGKTLVPGIPRHETNFRAGEAGTLELEAKPPDRILLRARCCLDVRRRTRPSLFFIHFDRRITPEDLAPPNLARAVSEFLEISGFEEDRPRFEISIAGTTVRIDEILFDSPAGWTPVEMGDGVHLSRPRGDTEIRLVAGEFDDEYGDMTPERYLTEHMPNVALSRLTRKARAARIDEIFPLRSLGPFALGGARLTGAKRYHRFDWIVDEPRGTALHLQSARVPTDEREAYDEAIEALLRSLRRPS